MKPISRTAVPWLLAALLVAGALLYFLVRPSQPREASMLLLNGVIYTLDERRPVAEAVALEGDKIAGVGSNEEIRKTFRSAKVIDLLGKTVVPGFIDAHLHLENLGASLMQLNLAGTTSVAEIQSLLSERVRRSKPGSWIRGRGWDQNRWPGQAFPTHEALDRVAPDNPVYFGRIDGHAVWVNRKALEIAGITARTPDPPGGKILRDKQGEPTGVFIDNAVRMLMSVLPEPSDEEREEAIEKAAQECVSVGLTEVHDMGVEPDAIVIYKRMIAAGRLPLRLYVAVDGTSPLCDSVLQAGPDTSDMAGHLTVRAVKLYADGALGSRGAALIAPYADDPGNRGLTLTSSGDLGAMAKKCLDHGFQLCVHAIGDRANDIVLDVYAGAFAGRAIDGARARFRIEHAQVLDSTAIPKFHRLGVLPVMQPTHCTSDMPWAEERLGPDRVRRAYAWRSLLDQGSIIPGSSDAPVESPNPLWGIYAAITRQDQAAHPAGGWHPEQRMTRAEALRSFTSWAAFAGFQEEKKGSIEPGKWADLTVLSDDIMKIEPQKILESKVAMTVIGGSIVYDSAGVSSAPIEGGKTRGQ